jgi:uncharacterized protein YggE
MKTKITLLLTVALLSSSKNFGQTVQTKNNDYPFIEVIGYAEKSVVPDEITISIKIKERYKNKEKITVQLQEDSLKYYLAKEELDLNNLTLSNANADYVQVKWSKKEVLREVNYLFKAIDAVQVSKVFQVAEKIRLYDAFILKVEYSKLDSLKTDIRIKATKNAKEKADQMLAAIGFKTGKAWIVQETIPGGGVSRGDYQSMASRGVYSVAATTAGIYQSDESIGMYSDEDDILNMRGSRSSNTSYYVDGDPYSLIAQRHNLSFSKIKISSSVYIKYEVE